MKIWAGFGRDTAWLSQCQYKTLRCFLSFCMLLPHSIGCCSSPVLFSMERSQVASPAPAFAAMVQVPAVDLRAHHANRRWSIVERLSCLPPFIHLWGLPLPWLTETPGAERHQKPSLASVIEIALAPACPLPSTLLQLDITMALCGEPHFCLSGRAAEAREMCRCHSGA